MDHDTHLALRPKLISFDVFGTLISVRDSSYSAFERILADAGAHHLDVKAFWEHCKNVGHAAACNSSCGHAPGEGGLQPL